VVSSAGAGKLRNTGSVKFAPVGQCWLAEDRFVDAKRQPIQDKEGAPAARINRRKPHCDCCASFRVRKPPSLSEFPFGR